jgi:glycosyltransferase involved in cell wall biosynthesis
VDYRNLSYFPSLMKYAAECNVLENFRVLGQIPFDHLAGLMRHATAFINPSRFEGWSTSVEEAKSMGKQVVLSDIAVHREQAPDRSFFFPPDDPDALAGAMMAADDEFNGQRDAAMQDEARARFPQRQRECGRKPQARNATNSASRNVMLRPRSRQEPSAILLWWGEQTVRRR